MIGFHRFDYNLVNKQKTELYIQRISTVIYSEAVFGISCSYSFLSSAQNYQNHYNCSFEEN